jgi:N6-L-threonylcarbamoyladenine synthase
MNGHGRYEILARTRDDAAGEAFDKSARAMGLGYPGGPAIDKASAGGNPRAVKFPRARFEGSLDFSFSGLKTAVIRYIAGHPDGINLADVAASFQQAVVDILVENTFKAAQERRVKQVVVAGGVAANRLLQQQMRDRGEELGISVTIPPPKYCTDNAAMSAAAGYFAWQRGVRGGLDLDSFATEPLAERARTI